MNLALQAAIAMLRHRKSRRPTFTALASILGIAFGVAAFLVVVTIFQSFKRELQSILLAANPHLIVYSISNAIPDARNTEAEIRKLLKQPVQTASLFEYTEGLLRHDYLTAAVVVRGIEGTRAANAPDIIRHITPADALARLNSPAAKGRLPEVILGNSLAGRLNAKVGDQVSLLTSTSDGRQVSRVLQVGGILALGLNGYDSRFALMNFEDASRTFGVPGSARGIEFRFKNPTDAERAALALDNKVPYPVQAWQWMDRSLFEQIKRDEVVISFIVLIISLVAGFNVLTTLSLNVVDRARQIAVMRALGATRRLILRIFLTIGLLLGVGGALLGITFGMLVLRFFENFELGDLKTTYFVDRIPVDYDPVLMLEAFGVALLLALVSSAYPAYRATRVSPLYGIKPGNLLAKEESSP